VASSKVGVPPAYIVPCGLPYSSSP
jgi:hypothetical protein